MAIGLIKSFLKLPLFRIFTKRNLLMGFYIFVGVIALMFFFFVKNKKKLSQEVIVFFILCFALTAVLGFLIFITPYGIKDFRYIGDLPVSFALKDFFTSEVTETAPLTGISKNAKNKDPETKKTFSLVDLENLNEPEEVEAVIDLKVD